MLSTAHKSLVGAGGLRALALRRSAIAGATTKTKTTSPGSPSPTAAPQGQPPGGGAQDEVKPQP
jgi:hypothetical protein